MFTIFRYGLISMVSTERALLGFMARSKKVGATIAVTSFLWGFICILNSYLIGYTIDAIFLSLADESGGFLGAIEPVLVLVASLLTGAFLTVTTVWLMGIFSARLSQSVRKDIFKALQDQSAKFYSDNSTGDLVSKATNDVTVIRQFSGNFALLLPIAVSEFIFCISFLLFIDVPLAILCIVTIPVSLVVSHYVKRDYGPIFGQARKHLGLLTNVISENVEGASLVRTFPSTDKEIGRFEGENSRYRNVALKAKKLKARIDPTTTFLHGLTWSLVLGFGGLRVIEGQITIGMLVSASFVANWLVVPIRHITNLMVAGSEAKAATARVLDILGSVPTIADPKNPVPLDMIHGEVSFDNVSFSYGKEPVLDNLTLTITSGSTVALLGGTGSGKSSLINLIPRFYDVSSGSVRVDGIDVREVKLRKLRRNIGFVDQESFLFSRTIAENIAFGRPDASFEEIQRCAKIACIHDFIVGLPEGYDTIVGERGVTLSGGQRQRLSIARTLLADPKIVIFDDSLSAVDVQTEKAIQQGLNQILKGHTTIVVTQRLSVTQNADYCIVMSNGQIVEVGKHQELLANEGAYARLYQSQVDGIMDLSVLNDHSTTLS